MYVEYCGRTPICHEQAAHLLDFLLERLFVWVLIFAED